MKAITITQPWATLMAMGEKRIETRTWIGHIDANEPLAIHAGVGPGDTPRHEIRRLMRTTYASTLDRAVLLGFAKRGNHDYVQPEDLPRGTVIAIARFEQFCRTGGKHCEAALEESSRRDMWHERYLGNYAWGRWAWVFSEVRPLRTPIPARGRPGLWTWNPPAQLEYREVTDATISW